MKYYDISNNFNNTQKERVFLLSGEHPRELIAVEAAYYFVEKLVTNQGKYKEYEIIYYRLLDNYNFRIIVNANPYARINVEKGEYCRRVNMKDVDINRNWNIFWGQKIDLEEENPGSGPFSEVETKFVKSLVKSFNPKIFLTLHSGVYGLYLPYAFLQKETDRDKGIMKNILNQIKEKYCPVCQVGAPSLKIGYQSSGTCLDYIYDKIKVPYSFAWEIYSNEVVHPEIAKLSRNRFLKRNNLFIETVNKIKPSNFLEVNEKDTLKLLNRNKFIAHRFYSSYENQVCLALFNPNEKKSFEFIIENWTNVK